MNNTQEEHFGMFLKVQNFLSVNAAALSANPAIAAFKTNLDGRIADIVTQDVIANTDNEGYTTAKTQVHADLLGSVIHVAQGLTGYFRNPLNMAMLGKVNQGKGFYQAASEAKLNTESEIIHQIADPIKTQLGPNFVTAADVDGLNTKRLAFLALMKVPKEKIGDQKAAREEMERLFELTNSELNGELDDLMAVQESVNPVLYSKYRSARNIDNIMGNSGTEGYNINTITIPAESSLIITISPGPLTPEKEIYVRSVQGNLMLCTTNLPASPCASGYQAQQGVTYKAQVGGLGLDLNLSHLQITNPGTEDGIIRIGLKQE